MTELSRKRCANHFEREAAALCPVCTRYFCRECVTEHKGQVICAACLRAKSAKSHGRFPVVSILRLTVFLASFVFLWFFFYLTGRTLASIPADYHEGVMWASEWWDE